MHVEGDWMQVLLWEMRVISLISDGGDLSSLAREVLLFCTQYIYCIHNTFVLCNLTVSIKLIEK